MEHYQLVIIGSGPGGYVAAIRAGQLGLKVAVIDRKENFGGTCLNVGCIPSKALLASSEMYHKAQDLSFFGVYTQGVSFDFAKMQERRMKIIDSFRKGIAALFQKNKVVHIEGYASFIDAKTLQVGDSQVSADAIMIASGSLVTELAHIRFDQDKILSSKEALELTQVPKSLAVIGGGVIGLELGSVYARLGSKVTVIEALDRLCATMDEELGAVAYKECKGLGMGVLLGTLVQSVTTDDKGVVLHTKEGKIEAEKVLVAVGRKPNTAHLGLDKAGINLDSKGCIIVNDQYQTNHPTVYAIGDVTFGPMLAHRASLEAIAVVHHLAGRKSRVCLTAIPSVMYTSPEMAQVGLTVKEALELGLKPKTGKSYFEHQSRAVASESRKGFVKVIIDEVTGRILGASIVSDSAGEMIHLFCLAISAKMTGEELLEAPFAHPTLSEAVMEAVGSALGRSIHGG